VTAKSHDSAISAWEMMLLLLLASVHFTSIVDFMVVMPLGQQLKRTLTITSSQFGLIVSTCFVGLQSDAVGRQVRVRAMSAPG
jgi:predicted MFS family arabinose efflux permease